jgi:predicted RNA-binding protein (TIGR00451 family)
MEPYLDDIIPAAKTTPIYSMKLKNNDKSILYIVNNTPLFFKVGKQAIPTLHILHKYPHIMKKACVDTGAIKFLLGGADMMAPGFTSEGGWLPGTEKEFTGGSDTNVVFAQPTPQNIEEAANEDTDGGKFIPFLICSEEEDLSIEFGPSTPLEEGNIVAIYAQGKKHALAIGRMAMD